MNNFKQLLILLISVCLPSAAYAYVVKAVTPKGNVVVTYEINNSREVYIASAYNQTTENIIVDVDGNLTYINAKGSASIGRVCRGKVTCESNTSSRESYKTSFRSVILKADEILQNHQPSTVEPKPVVTDNAPEAFPAAKKSPAVKLPARAAAAPRTIDQFNETIDNDDFWGENATSEFVERGKNYVENLSKSTNKQSYIEKSGVMEFVETGKHVSDSLAEVMTPFVIGRIIEFCSKNKNISPDFQNQIQADITNRLQYRLNRRNEILAELESEIADAANTSKPASRIDKSDLVNYGVIAIIVLLLIIISIQMTGKHKHKGVSKVVANQPQAAADIENPTIVVRRKTTSILKKLYIDDVKDNSDYKKISATDFCQDSAVRDIYIKNSCVKEIYDIYAEDLRNADKPKEDGCMVLGRWVYDEDAKTYDVTLESVVLPGDDAVFKEYELNFGGKIKLRVAEKLRKLRKDTNYQYDLTCWVHSHPGLGVFFSNSDSNVQMQLKHPQHPNFLIAFVVDILTDNQEMGIFTFRSDGSINSKQDLVRMYSLEELYKWAIESSKHSFSAESHFNVLQNAEMTTDSCRGIELNNNAIIDLSQIAMESPQTGLIGWAVGYSAITEKGNEYVVTSIYRQGQQPGTGISGCLISVTHLSLPTIQRIIASCQQPVKFVLAYSSRQMTLTAIPVVNGEIISDEKFYSEETLDNLKIWTRRRR